MKTWIGLIVYLLLASCGNSALVSDIAESDSVAVQFYEPGTNKVAKAVQANKDYAVQKLVQLVDGKKDEIFKCGYDGNILFYQKASLVRSVYFNLTTDGCHHFLHTVNGKPVATTMSNEGVDFLNSLAAGR